MFLILKIQEIVFSFYSQKQIFENKRQKLLPNIALEYILQLFFSPNLIFLFSKTIFYFIEQNRQKCKTDPLTFTFFHFSHLTFSFVNSVL